MPTRNDTYTGWGRVLSASGERSRPDTMSAVKPNGPAIGNRRSYGDAALNGAGHAIDITALDGFLSFDEQTGLLHVEAGCRIGEIARVFAPRGWVPAVMPGTGFATVGGCIGMDVHGKNHHNAGSFGQHVTELTLLNDDGLHTVTPADAALFRATVGGLGQTGVILSAKLQLKAVRGPLMSVTEQRAESWDEHVALLDASEAEYCVGWIDATATGDSLGRGIVEEGEFVAGIIPREKASKSVPIDAPNWALSNPVVKAFNAAYYRRVPARGRTTIKRIEAFFFPLDKIHDWNRLYGKRGFHQFQCVVPLDQKAALRDILNAISTSGLASPLAVLKRMGPGKAGHLSFPMEGYTLAVDFPASAEAEALIKSLIAKTVTAQGRIYLAKDGLATGSQIRAMYPEFSQWRDTVEHIDPRRIFETDLTRRLNLRSET